MAETSFPYGSVNHDRRYKSSDFRAYYALFLGNGVFYNNSDALKVNEGDGMTVMLSIGNAFIEGVGYRNKADLALKLDTADGALSRIDRIVIRNDYKIRDTYAAVLKGTYSAQPQAPALTRNADAYEIAVADVLVAKGVASITQADITDTRLNTELCGIVTGLVQQADTTAIFNQFEAYLEDFKAQYIADIMDWTSNEESGMTEWENTQREAFLAWVEEIKQILNESVAGNLQNEIEAEAFTAFQRHYGLVNSSTEFMPDGSIVVTNEESTLTVTKGTDESGNKQIIEQLEKGIDIYEKITTFLPATDTENKTIREEYKKL
ncbi:MAG: hypothetical protein Q4C65_02880 [Eubacteriales bacterium]|nr:hypothetical protein [Eubacteriales bacterium]